jgi:hypothetical protein
MMMQKTEDSALNMSLTADVMTQRTSKHAVWTSSNGVDMENPTTLKYLMRTNAKKEKGWLRKVEVETDKPARSHLIVTEKQLIISLKQILGPSVDTVTAFAWGVVLKTVRRIQKKSFAANGLAVSRKVRFDKGHILFTSNAKCQQVYTPLCVRFTAAKS